MFDRLMDNQLPKNNSNRRSLFFDDKNDPFCDERFQGQLFSDFRFSDFFECFLSALE